MHSNPWKILAAKNVYENPWIHVTEFEVLNPKGKEGIYGKVSFKNRAVGVVAIDSESQVFLVGQYRFTLEQYSWELPEGGSPIDESLLATAKRELLEEAGIKAKKWEHLLDIHLSNSVTDEFGCIYLATDLEYGESNPEDTEVLMVKKLHLDSAIDMIYKGEITDSLTIAGLLRTKLLFIERKIN